MGGLDSDRALLRLRIGKLVFVEGSRVGNEVGGGVHGAVVQAGSIQQVLSLTGAIPARADWTVVPRQLPGVVRDFTGRAEHLVALDALLPPEAGARPGMGVPEAVVITAVDGAAGIGKTTLAVWWAHRVQHDFPHGTLYVNLRGYGPGDPATATDVLDGFLRALGVPPERMPIGAEAQAGLFRSLLAGRRVLVVLDNAHRADQVRPLLPGTPGCLVVVTSRDSLTGLVVMDGASRLTLDLLTEYEATHLVTGILGPDRADTEAAAVSELVRWCARLPLALRIAAGRAVAYPHTTVADVVTDLADEHARLDVLSLGGDERTAVRAVFDWSYHALSDRQARVFRRLGLHPGPEVSVHAASAVTDLDPPATRRVLEELAQVHLIEPVAQGRFRFHDLLRAYALDQTMREDSQARPGPRPVAPAELVCPHRPHLRHAGLPDPLAVTAVRRRACPSDAGRRPDTRAGLADRRAGQPARRLAPHRPPQAPPAHPPPRRIAPIPRRVR